MDKRLWPCGARGKFTWVEFVVAAVVMLILLAWILLPAFSWNRGHRSTPTSRDAARMHVFYIALFVYNEDNGQLPFCWLGRDHLFTADSQPSYDDLVACLVEDKYLRLNQPFNKAAVDDDGTPFRIALDMDGDGHIDSRCINGSSVVHKRWAVWSLGPDQRECVPRCPSLIGANADNRTSWGLLNDADIPVGPHRGCAPPPPPRPPCDPAAPR